MSHYSPRHSHKYFEFVEHTKPKRRRGRHVRVLAAAPKRVDAWLAS